MLKEFAQYLVSLKDNKTYNIHGDTYSDHDLVRIKPRVALRPFRTFLEVEQPESEFLLRLDDDGNVGLFEADGGMWQQTAKASIAAYFEDKLAQEVKDGKIVVMM